MFEKIKYYYNKGLYTKANLSVLVVHNAITATQYQEITGEVYQA